MAGFPEAQESAVGVSKAFNTTEAGSESGDLPCTVGIVSSADSR